MREDFRSKWLRLCYTRADPRQLGACVFIRRIRIKNVRVIQDLSLELSPVTVLVGDNNSGKSTVLDGITNFSNVGRGNFRLPPEGKYSFDALRSQAPGAEPFIEYEVEVGKPGSLGLVYVLRYSKKDSGLVIDHETLTFGPSLLFDRANQDQMTLTSITSVGADETVLSAIRRSLRTGGQEDSSAVADLAKSVGNVMTFRLVPYVMAQPAPLPSEDDTMSPRLAGNGYGLATLLAHLHESTRHPDIAAREEILGLLRTHIVGFQDFSFAQSDADKVEFSVTFDDARGSVRANQLSDGTLSLIGHIALLCSPSRPALMGLEEPESGLTTKSLRGLMRTISAAGETRPGRWPSQVVIATHSPYIVSWAWENLGEKAVYETACSGGRASIQTFLDAHPEIEPGGALGPNAVVTAMGWQFG